MESDHKISLIESRHFPREDIHPFVKIDNGQALTGHQFSLLISTPILRHLSLRIQLQIDCEDILRDLIEQADEEPRIGRRLHIFLREESHYRYQFLRSLRKK